MAIDRNKMYMVVNEYPHYVGFPMSVGDMLMLEPADMETGEPSRTLVHFEDILRAHTQGSLIKTGLVFFEKECEAEIYEELRIPNWENIWHREDIKEALLNPTIDKLQRIIDGRERSVFERIRGVYTGLINAGYDVPRKTRDVIENRFVEWQNNLSTSKIVLKPKTAEDGAAEAKLAELQSKLEALEAKLSAPEVETPVVETTKPVVTKAEEPKPVVAKKVDKPAKDTVAPTPKKRGRPPKAK